MVGAMLVGGGLWVALGSDDESEAEPPVTTEDPSEADVETTIPVLVESTVPATTVVVDGSIDGEFVRMDWFDAVISDADIATTLTDLGMRESDNPVATTSDVLNLCAAVPTSSPTNATVEWALDGEPVSTGAMRVLETPADGNCINNNGAALTAGLHTGGPVHPISLAQDAIASGHVGLGGPTVPANLVRPAAAWPKWLRPAPRPTR